MISQQREFVTTAEGQERNIQREIVRLQDDLIERLNAEHADLSQRLHGCIEMLRQLKRLRDMRGTDL